MTCIIGIVDKKNKRVLIGADSAGVAGNNITIRKDTKVFSVGEFVIGCTSSFRMIDILKYNFTPPKFPVYTEPKKFKEDRIHKYMCTLFIDEIRKVFKDSGFMEKHSEAEFGGFFLVGYKNRLFKIENDFQVGESKEGFDSIGCGSDFAIGAMNVLINSPVSHRTKIELALKTSAKFNTGVRGPFIIETTY